jgi:hypothetical protein
MSDAHSPSLGDVNSLVSLFLAHDAAKAIEEDPEADLEIAGLPHPAQVLEAIRQLYLQLKPIVEANRERLAAAARPPAEIHTVIGVSDYSSAHVALMRAAEHVVALMEHAERGGRGLLPSRLIGSYGIDFQGLSAHLEQERSKLAESSATPTATRKRKSGRQSKELSSFDELVLAALRKHHQYESGGSVGNFEPAIGNQLSREYKLSNNALGRFLKKEPRNLSYAQYAASCRNGSIGRLLVSWSGETPSRTGLTNSEYGCG